MIINLLLFLTFSQQQHHRKVVRTLGPHTERFDSSQGKLLNFKYFSPRSEIFVHNFLQQSSVHSFSCLMIIKCTTSGNWEIISYLTPHAIGRKIIRQPEKTTFGKIKEIFLDKKNF